MISKFNNDENVSETSSFLSFKLSEENFAIPVAKVLEILEVPKITKVPNAPAFLTGVVNLRGSVLPVINTRSKFGMSDREFTVDTCILVLSLEMNSEKMVVGILVDSVSEVFEIEEKNIQLSPSIGTAYRSDFIQGMIRDKDKFMMLIDIDKVFSVNEIESLIESKAEPVGLAS